MPDAGGLVTDIVVIFSERVTWNILAVSQSIVKVPEEELTVEYVSL